MDPKFFFCDWVNSITQTGVGSFLAGIIYYDDYIVSPSTKLSLIPKELGKMLSLQIEAMYLVLKENYALSKVEDKEKISRVANILSEFSKSDKTFSQFTNDYLYKNMCLGHHDSKQNKKMSIIHRSLTEKLNKLLTPLETKYGNTLVLECINDIDNISKQYNWSKEEKRMFDDIISRYRNKTISDTIKLYRSLIKKSDQYSAIIKNFAPDSVMSKQSKIVSIILDDHDAASILILQSYMQSHIICYDNLEAIDVLGSSYASEFFKLMEIAQDNNMIQTEELEDPEMIKEFQENPIMKIMTFCITSQEWEILLESDRKKGAYYAAELYIAYKVSNTDRSLKEFAAQYVTPKSFTNKTKKHKKHNTAMENSKRGESQSNCEISSNVHEENGANAVVDSTPKKNEYEAIKIEDLCSEKMFRYKYSTRKWVNHSIDRLHQEYKKRGGKYKDNTREEVIQQKIYHTIHGVELLLNSRESNDYFYTIYEDDRVCKYLARAKLKYRNHTEKEETESGMVEICVLCATDEIFHLYFNNNKSIEKMFLFCKETDDYLDDETNDLDNDDGFAHVGRVSQPRKDSTGKYIIDYFDQSNKHAKTLYVLRLPYIDKPSTSIAVSYLNQESKSYAALP